MCLRKPGTRKTHFFAWIFHDISVQVDPNSGTGSGFVVMMVTTRQCNVASIHRGLQSWLPLSLFHHAQPVSDTRALACWWSPFIRNTLLPGFPKSGFNVCRTFCRVTLNSNKAVKNSKWCTGHPVKQRCSIRNLGRMAACEGSNGPECVGGVLLCFFLCMGCAISNPAQLWKFSLKLTLLNATMALCIRGVRDHLKSSTPSAKLKLVIIFHRPPTPSKETDSVENEFACRPPSPLQWISFCWRC